MKNAENLLKRAYAKKGNEMRGPIEPDDEEASKWGFTSDRWEKAIAEGLPGSYLFIDHDRVYLSVVKATKEGHGYLKELIAGIEKAGYKVAVPCPLGRMEVILKHYGFVPHTEYGEVGETAVWERPLSSALIQQDGSL